MRRVKIFAGSSHPLLTEAICERLGTQPANCELKKFSNGETNVSINTSIRDQDVFIVQSGSTKINDSVMELLIMISACKGSSARSITAVMPYFPYSRQSKKKSHRGAITARMLANLLSVAGVQHVITVDLHAAPMQGFFGKPVDNLYAEPLIARWIRNNVPDWKEAVVVSKNPGGTKRVTSLADALKLNFGIVTTDRRRSPVNGTNAMETSTIFANMIDGAHNTEGKPESEPESEVQVSRGPPAFGPISPRREGHRAGNQSSITSYPALQSHRLPGSSPLTQSTRVESESPPPPRSRPQRSMTAPVSTQFPDPNDITEYTDERAREVITGRLFQGHIVDDDFPSPMLSAMSGSMTQFQGEHLGSSHFDDRDPMAASFMSTASSHQPRDPSFGGSYDAAASSDEEEEGFKNAELEQTITLVGNVRDRTVFIIDDMIDRSGSWIAAAETIVKRGGAKKVYCIATHALFGDGSLDDMEDCQCIDYIVVTNTFPISPEKLHASEKLVVLDMSGLLAEAIRRNHYGESISQLYQHYQD